MTNQTDITSAGIGGAIYYLCSLEDSGCDLQISNTNFTKNYAAIRGGAIHYNYYEPVFGAKVLF